MDDIRKLVPAETVKINFSTYEVEILNSDHSLKRRQIVSRSTIWRLIKIYVNTHEDWRSLEWNRSHQGIATFRHKKEISLTKTMTLTEYLQQELMGEDDE